MFTFMVTVSLVVLFATYMTIMAFRTKRLLRQSCATMLDEMRHVNYAEVCSIARLGPQEQSFAEIVLRIGGVEGLRRMQVNAGVMLNVANYLSLVDPDAHAIAVQIKNDAMELRRMLVLLEWRMRFRPGHRQLTTSAHKFCLLYVSMTVKHLTACDHLVDGLLHLTNLVTGTQIKIMRAPFIPASHSFID